MSKEAIKTALTEFNQKVDSFTFVEEELVNLLVALSEHVLEQGNDAPVKMGYISLKDFEKKYKYITESTVRHHCLNNPDIHNLRYRHKGKWYLNAEPLWEYYKNTRRVKKLIDKFEKS